MKTYEPWPSVPCEVAETRNDSRRRVAQQNVQPEVEARSLSRVLGFRGTIQGSFNYKGFYKGLWGLGLDRGSKLVGV